MPKQYLVSTIPGDGPLPKLAVIAIAPNVPLAAKINRITEPASVMPNTTFSIFFTSIFLQEMTKTAALTTSSLSFTRYDIDTNTPTIAITIHSFLEYLVVITLMQKNKKVSLKSCPSHGLVYALLSIITITHSIMSAIQKHRLPGLFIFFCTVLSPS